MFTVDLTFLVVEEASQVALVGKLVQVSWGQFSPGGGFVYDTSQKLSVAYVLK